MSETRPRRSGRRLKPQKRVPAWVVLPLSAGVGYAVSSWLGLIFGLVIGVFLWQMRR